jgi:hypothetical protein
MFVLPDAADAKQIFVRKMLASYNGKSVIGNSLTDVIAQLFPGFSMNLGDRVGGSTGGPTTTTIPGSPTTTVPAGSGLTARQMLQQADRLFAEADAALAKNPPDFAMYQTKTLQARALVQKALTAIK